MRRWLSLSLIPLALIAPALVGCAPREAADDATAATSTTAAEPVVIYSGRNKSLIEPLLARAAAVATEVRYGDTAELAAQLLEEGAATPCDLFIAQDAAALGAIASRGLFAELPPDVLGRLPAAFVSPEGLWVGLSGRARTVVYNSELVKPEDLPRSLEDVGDPGYRGRFGVAPVNGSFQAHMAVYYAANGGEALERLLAAMAANEPQRYPKNSAIVEAVNRGEIEWGLVNHYYLWRAKKQDPGVPGVNFFMPGGGVSNFVNLAGAGVVDARPEVFDLLRYLLSEEAQRYFAEETYEYPLVAGVEPALGLEPLGDQIASQIDFAAVSEALEPTLELISSTGLLQ